jgi:CDP-glycerol glycerophosphotransferase
VIVGRPLSRLPLLRRLPTVLEPRSDDLVLFESWHGAYSDNPRAVSEEIRARGLPLRQTWVLDDREQDLPPSGARVRPGSPQHLRALGAARWIVTNSNLPGFFRKRAGTSYVQTWHGTPLKRIAFDIPTPSFGGSGKYLRNLSRDVSQWDLLVSPNPFSTAVFRRAFGYAGEVLETGYPRNDVLSSPQRDDLRAAIRRRLGIAPGARAVLYAPTWRDSTGFDLRLDLGRLADAAGEDSVILLRAHSLVAAAVGAQEHRGVRDVSSHADIRDLYLAADVLITDYSSVMFDFAVTGRPILLFTYDMEHYRDDLRGFYFDLEADAPGPLLTDTEQVVEALTDLDAVTERHAERYARFRERFCALEDGRASARVLDAMLRDTPFAG